MAAPALTDQQLLDLTGENTLNDIKELTLRNHKLASFEGIAAKLGNLQVLSLSHNQIATLAGFETLKQLVSLNLNFNALQSLEGVHHCSALQHLYVASNRIRDATPVTALGNLQTLHLFRNAINNLDVTVAALAQLPWLRELELGGNPCSVAADYKHRLIAQLSLERLDGDAVTELDHELADQYYTSQPNPGAQVLTLEPDGGEPNAAAGATPSDRASSGAAAAAGPGSSAANLPPRPATAAGLFRVPPPRPGTALLRPGSGGARPATPGTIASVQLLSDELLNDHPLVLEYLAKHVLLEGMALVNSGPNGSGASGSAGGSGGGGPPGGGRTSSFAQRLRDTAAAMSACEGMDTKSLAGQQELIVSASTARRAAVEHIVANASVHELCRQLIKLCEVLVKEVEAARQNRPGSGGSTARPTTSSGIRPLAPGQVPPPPPPPVDPEVLQLRAEVDRLTRENKALSLENQNVFWLADEVKKLKAELKAAKGGETPHR